MQVDEIPNSDDNLSSDQKIKKSYTDFVILSYSL